MSEPFAAPRNGAYHCQRLGLEMAFVLIGLAGFTWLAFRYPIYAAPARSSPPENFSGRIRRYPAIRMNRKLKKLMVIRRKSHGLNF
jgi:hypothetical protein